ncbi:hypothetical protein QF002_001175 [Paraburkholderia youngii]
MPSGDTKQMSENRACMGATTESCRMSDLGHAQRCRSCGTRVVDELVHHKFFGFEAACVHKIASNRSPDAGHLERSL